MVWVNWLYTIILSLSYNSNIRLKNQHEIMNKLKWITIVWPIFLKIKESYLTAKIFKYLHYRDLIKVAID